MRLAVRLLPVAGLIAFMALAGMRAQRADANAATVTAQVTGTGNTITVTATYSNNPAGATATLIASGAGSFSTATAAGGTGVTVGAFQAGTTVVTTTADTSGNTANMITISASFTCTSGGQVSFTLTQAGGTPATATSSAMTCGAGAQAGPTPFLGYTNQQYGYGTNAMNGQYPAGYNPQQYPNGQYPAGYNPQYPNGVNPQMYPNGIVPNVPNAQQPQASNAAGASGNLTTVSSSPATVNCGGTSTLTVNAKTANGSPAQDGTTVSLYSSLGSLNPKTGATKGGTFTTTFTAPNSAGTATIIASVAGNAGSSDLTVSCTGAPAGTSSTASTSSTPGATGPTGQAISAPPPPITSAQSDPSLSSGSAPVLRPPSTGDAGLLALRGDNSAD